MKRGRSSKSQITFVVVIVSIPCFLVLILSVFTLPDISFSNGSRTSIKLKKLSKISENGERIRTFATMMIQMLPQDLPFTIFVPSKLAFERDLRLRVNDSLVGEKADYE
ncbi:hypothetical protein L2E82_51660 [Cichorium intybus]|nr:hypothetical protein L2E82_51660 [Cichorium intybus]